MTFWRNWIAMSKSLGATSVTAFVDVAGLLAAPAAVGDWLILLSADVLAPAGIWVVRPSGRFCFFLDLGIAAPGAFLVGTADTDHLQLDTMAVAPTWSGDGIKPLPGTITRIIARCAGNFPRDKAFAIDGRTKQSYSAGAAAGDWFGVGADLERHPAAPAELMGAGAMAFNGATWQSRVAYSVWPATALVGGAAWTLDTDGIASYSRTPSGGTGSSTTGGTYNGDTTGAGTGSASFILPDGWTSGGDCYPCFFYDPGASDLEVSFRGFTLTSGVLI